MKELKQFPYFFIGLFLALGLVMTSCEEEVQEAAPKPKVASTGDAGEIEVILDKQYWSGKLINEINTVFEKEILSLPQPEPYFNILPITHEGFGSGATLHHSILVITIDPNMKASSSYIADKEFDKYADNQMIYKIKASSEQVALEIFKANSEILFAEYDAFSKKQISTRFAHLKSDKINEELGLTLKINANVPKPFTVSANHSDFVWMQEKRMRKSDGQQHEIQVGLMMYTYPYIDSSTFSQEWVLNKRDSITKKYIKGFIENSYMITERGYGLESFEKNFNGNYLFETRGVWKMQGSIMGGPFVNLTFYDEPRNRIVVVEGYVFAPQFRKMEFIREIEAILYSIEFVD